MLLEKLQAVCADAPDRVAVVAGTSKLTYAQLQEQMDWIAAALFEADVLKGSLVAIYGRRSVEMLACMLGVMRAGAAYTVVEDDGEVEEHYHRLSTMKAQLVLCNREHVERLRQLGVAAMAIEVACRPGPTQRLRTSNDRDTAYVLFTSGSTGKPKGVAVTHGNIAHYTAAIRARLQVASAMRYAHISTLAADLGNTSLFLSLWTGGTLHLLDGRLRKDPAAMRDYLSDHAIQFLKITPSHWNAVSASMADPQARPVRLEYLVLGGEVLTVNLARRILDSGVVRVLSNHYGPTETTVGVTAFSISHSSELQQQREAIPIGRPLGRTVLRVRTEEDKYLEHGTGELYIGGPSVARGYVGNPAMTRSRFVTLEDEPSGDGKFYRTGDHVCIDPDGLVHFMGRVDRQVKVNGYRVELEHIENVLRGLPGVEDAAVFFLEIADKKRLVAAILNEHDRELLQLEQRMAQVLPEYMIPKRLLRLSAFPCNSNGKTDLKVLREQVLELLRETPATPSAEVESAPPASSLVIQDLRAAWSRSLGERSFGNDDDFFKMGGDSLDAITLIAELQVQGYPVNAHAFLQRPTISALADYIARAGAAKPVAAEQQLALSVTRAFSPAQSFFLRQALAAPDHYNQAVLLQCAQRIDTQLLRTVITDLVAAHPLLHTSFASDAEGRFARPDAPIGADLFSSSNVDAHDDTAIEAHIESTAEKLQQSLSLARGALFRAHLFKLGAGQDQLLLVAHHIAVDVISWRILITELTRLYSERSAGVAAVAAPAHTSFWSWLEHVARHRAALEQSSSSWLENCSRLPMSPYDAANTEGAARTGWIGFTTQQTERLVAAAAQIEAPLHALLLGSFVHCWTRRTGVAHVWVEVESHGRLTLDDSIDISRTVGWHTSTYPVRLPVDAQHVNATIRATTTALQAVQDLGVAYGLRESAHGVEPAQPAAALCFNYLGDINFSAAPGCALTASRYSVGRARGAANHRGHELKLSGRILGGCLVVDLSAPDTLPEVELRLLMSELKQKLSKLAGDGAPATAHDVVIEAGTRTGILSYIPQGLQLRTPRAATRDYRTVLLTGATGYVGAHVLMELVRQSRAHVLCLVRPKGAAGALQRLHETLEFYFQDTELQSLAERFTVLDGDAALPRFGLDAATYQELCDSVDALYHFAADTRLFGPEEEFQRNNVQPVRHCIEFVSTGCSKDLHHMSTLAVCGVNPRSTVIEFSEDSTDVGQEFQNHYEATKYSAEQLLQRFAAEGGRTFIYRSGNVSGDSRTARFQRAAGTNRFVQLLAACVKLGKAPRTSESIVLSPIDQVAAGIVAISLDSATPGGIFHVDSPHEIAIERFFEALRRAGIAVGTCEHDSFASLFNAVRDTRATEIAVGRFWASRKPRNVRYNHTRTLQLLQLLNRPFTELEEEWLGRFVEGLDGAGVFNINPATVRAAATRNLAHPTSYARPAMTSNQA